MIAALALLVVAILVAVTRQQSTDHSTPAPSTSPPTAAGPTPTGSPFPTATSTAIAGGPRGPVRVQGRNLVDASGKPFIWIADTAWDLPGRLTREQVIRYLDTRRAQGFTVIQTVGVFRRLNDGGNAYGDKPIQGTVSNLVRTPGDDPADPTAYDYWDHLDFVINAAAQRGLTLALWPIWSFNHAGSSITADNARGYGQFLAKRYAGRPIVWVMGGDDKVVHTDIWRALSAGIIAGTPGTRPLITYHPAGFASSLEALPEVDFHMVQSSHCLRNGHVPLVSTTLQQAGGKPLVDSEPPYEGHPWCWRPEQGYVTADQARAHQYWAVFAGAFGASYGHHSVWQFADPAKRAVLAYAQGSWTQALQAPAARQMRHLGTLLRARPLEDRIADDTVILSDRRSGWDQVAGVRDGTGRYLMAYLPTPGPIRLDLDRLPGGRVRVSWFNPRTGNVVDQGVRDKAAARTLAPPTAGDAGSGSRIDWVVIVDRVS